MQRWNGLEQIIIVEHERIRADIATRYVCQFNSSERNALSALKPAATVNSEVPPNEPLPEIPKRPDPHRR